MQNAAGVRLQHAILPANIFELRPADQPVDGMLLRARLAAAPVCRQCDRLAGDVCRYRLAVGRELAANSICEGQQDRAANFEDLVAEFVVAFIEQLLGFRQWRRVQQIDFSFAGYKRPDLENGHASARQNGGGKKFWLVVLRDGWAMKDDDGLATDRRFRAMRGRILAIGMPGHRGQRQQCAKTKEHQGMYAEHHFQYQTFWNRLYAHPCRAEENDNSLRNNDSRLPWNLRAANDRYSAAGQPSVAASVAAGIANLIPHVIAGFDNNADTRQFAGGQLARRDAHLQGEGKPGGSSRGGTRRKGSFRRQPQAREFSAVRQRQAAGHQQI